VSLSFSGSAGGLLELGLTGLMTNGTDDYADLFDPGNMTAGGAPGVLGVDLVDRGDAITSANTQEYGFQRGVDVGGATAPFVVPTRVVAPFEGATLGGYQSAGLFVGPGTQDDYLKWVVSGVAGGGAGGAGPLVGRRAGRRGARDGRWRTLLLRRRGPPGGGSRPLRGRPRRASPSWYPCPPSPS